MQNYQMVHPSIFMQNEIIKSIADEPFWTISDDKKRPVDAHELLHNNVVRNARFDNEHSPMVSLHELDDNPNLIAVNRAYRLRARENRIIMIDVEPEAPDSMKNQVLQFPSHYTELSRNGGVHLLIKVPEDCINDDNRYMFDELSVFKEPVPKSKGDEESRSAHFEVLFNDHFITFTKKMDMNVFANPADFENNSEQKQQLISFINNIVAMDKERKLQREKIKQYQLDRIDSEIDEEQRKLIEWFIGIEAFDVAYDKVKETTPEQFGNDMSRYEMSIASTFAHHTVRNHKLLLGSRSFRDRMMALRVKDLIHAIYLMVSESVPYRGKHDEFRDGMTWLLYVSKGAYEYIKSAQNNKKKE